MTEQSVAYPHLEITFATGTDLLILAPMVFDVDPARNDSGIIYCQVRFETPWCKGGTGAVLTPEDIIRLRSGLVLLVKGESGPFDVCDLDKRFRIEGDWNNEHHVAAFQATMPARIGSGEWCLWYDPSHYQDRMMVSMELEFWMKPDSLEEPLAATEAVLEHLQRLRARFAG